jgi:hypothetical protein
MLEILSTNRDLEKAIEEEETMLSQVKYSQLPSFNKYRIEAGTD